MIKNDDNDASVAGVEIENEEEYELTLEEDLT